MRLLIGLGLFLCSCQLLPHKQLGCVDSEYCEPVVSAPFVLGQSDAKTNYWLTGFSWPAGIKLTTDGKLFVADLLTNRFMVWNSFPTRNYQPADYVLGNANASLGAGCCTMGEYVPFPRHLSQNGNQLFAISADDDGNQLTTLYSWSSIPAKHTPPNTSLALNTGGTPMMPILAGPGAAVVTGGHLYLSDYFSNRLLIWNTVPTMPPAAANVVIGQANFKDDYENGVGGSPMANTLRGPLGMSTDGAALFVADSLNHRVLIWKTLPIPTANTNAGAVLGQKLTTDGLSNQGKPVPDGTTLSEPNDVAVGGGRLAVADTGNNRVLLWNSSTVATGAAANVVLGQTTNTGALPNEGGISGARMSQPIAVDTDGTHVVVGDTKNHRVLLWKSWPTADGTPADIILGQPTATTNGSLGFNPSNDNFLVPAGMARSAKGFFVADQGGNRVLIYATPPLGSNERAITILGESGITPAAPSTTTLSGPTGLSAEGDALAVADTNNNRVAIWNNIAVQNQQPIDVVLGQPDTSSKIANNGSPSVGLNAPQGVFLRGGKLYVADSKNHRVLIWNSLPTRNQQPADVVLGQADMMGTLQNRNGGVMPTADTLFNPRGIFVDDTSIYVCDSSAFRILIWKTVTPSSGQPADLVLGQDSLVGNKPPVAASANNLSLPVALSGYRNRLYVADQAAHRIVYYDLNQLTNGMAAQGVYGQADLNSGIPNRGGLDIDRLNKPTAVLAIENGLYISDSNNSRVIAQPPQL